MIATLLAMALVVQAPKGDWKPFKSPKGDFTAVFLSKPAEKKRAWKFSGGVVDLVTASVKRGVTTYEISYGDLPRELAEDPQKALDAGRDDIIKQLKADVGRESPTEWKGHPGRELTVDVPKAVVVGGASGRIKLLLIGRRLYQVAAIVPTADRASKAAELTGFLDGFAPIAEAKSEPTTGPSPATKWEIVTSAEGRFEILMPSKPVESSRELKTGETTKTIIRSLTALQPLNVKFDVNYFDYPAGKMATADREKYYDTARDGAIARSRVTLLSEKRPALDGRPGREMIIALPVDPKAPGPVAVRTRSYLLDDRLYTIYYSGPRGTETSKEVDAFFESFRLVNPGAAPKLPVDGTRRLTGWIEFDSDALGYRVKFPGKPIEKDERASTRRGEVLTHNVNIRDGQAIYQVSSSEMAEDIAASKLDLLTMMRKGTVGKGKLLSSRDIKLGDVAGMEFIYEPDIPGIPAGAPATARIFIVGRKVYAVVCFEIVKGAAGGKIVDFLDSFKITAK